MITIAFLAVLSATSPDGGVTDAGRVSPPAIDFGQACNQYSFNPDCLKAAPIKVECPRTREEVTPGSLCGLEGTTTSTPRCTFGQEVCQCKHRQYCGGVAPGMLQQLGMHWECAPKPKAGDCPETAPNPGSRCSVKKQQCSWGGCGSTQECTCSSKGKWSCATRYWAPPP